MNPVAMFVGLLFWGWFLILGIGGNRGGNCDDQCAGNGENATETHLENSCNSKK